MLLDCLQDNPCLLIPDRFKRQVIPSLKPFLLKYDNGDLLAQTFSGKHLKAIVFDADFKSPTNLGLTNKTDTMALVSLMNGDLNLLLSGKVRPQPVGISRLVLLNECKIALPAARCRFSMIYWNADNLPELNELISCNINRFCALSPEDIRVFTAEKHLNESQRGIPLIQEALFQSVIVRALEQFESKQLQFENMDNYAREAQQLRCQFEENFDKPKIIRKYIKDKISQKINRRFQMLYNLTPAEYLVQVRLSHARKYLLGTDIPIQEVAWAAGFESPSVFSRHFEKNAKISPSKFRAIHKQNN